MTSKPSPDKELFTAWITKYALSSGIVERVVEHTGIDGMIERRDCYSPEYFHGDDWHYSKEGAVLKAEEMRKRKITSLEKQIEKLKKKDFRK